MLSVASNTRKALLAEKIGVGKAFDPTVVKIVPINSPITPSHLLDHDTVLASAATFAGGEPKPVTTWGAPYRDGNEIWYCDGPLMDFVATADPASAETIYGFAWDMGSDVAYEPLDTPVVISRAGSVVSYIPRCYDLM